MTSSAPSLAMDFMTEVPTPAALANSDRRMAKPSLATSSTRWRCGVIRRILWPVLR